MTLLKRDLSSIFLAIDRQLESSLGKGYSLWSESVESVLLSRVVKPEINTIKAIEGGLPESVETRKRDAIERAFFEWVELRRHYLAISEWCRRNKGSEYVTSSSLMKAFGVFPGQALIDRAARYGVDVSCCLSFLQTESPTIDSTTIENLEELGLVDDLSDLSNTIQ